MSLSLQKSYLFVPANRPDRFASALNSAADAVIIDLEDALPIAEKIDARNQLEQWLSPARPVFIRINACDTEWFSDDARLCGHAGVAGVVLPKTEQPVQIEQLHELAGRPLIVLPLIETALGMYGADQIAHCPGVQRLIFGTLDFMADMGLNDDQEALNFYRSQLALVSRVANRAAPVDGVTTAISDLSRLRQDSENGRRYGFGAKLCIHPSQISTVNQCFSPGQSEIEWAQRVTAAMQNSDGVSTIDGKMLDRPVLLRAEKILANATKLNSD